MNNYYIYTRKFCETRTHKTITINIEKPVFAYVLDEDLNKIYICAFNQILNRWLSKEPSLKLEETTTYLPRVLIFKISCSKNFERLSEMVQELVLLHSWFVGLTNNQYISEEQIEKTMKRILRRWKFTPKSKLIEKVSRCQFYLDLDVGDKDPFYCVGEYLHQMDPKSYLNYGIHVQEIEGVPNQYKVTCYNESTNLHRLVETLKLDQRVLFLKLKAGLKSQKDII